MDANAVAGVRRFNRVVTTRVGALDDHYLARGRPLSQSRTLWEIGPDGCEVALLRARLALDSAQLSRTLRALELDGLVDVAPHTDDTRVRVATLTSVGRREWRVLEKASDRAAVGILTPLSEAQRHRLVQAMADVERLLMASMVEIAEAPPTSPAARACLRAYSAEVQQRIGGRFDSGGGDDRLAPPHGVLLVATLQGEPIGCGGLKLSPGAPPEVKRLWTAPSARGLGLGRRLLLLLEHRAAEAGADRVRLDTERSLTEAIALYHSAGYLEIPRYNDNPHAHHWFEKRLA